MSDSEKQKEGDTERTQEKRKKRDTDRTQTRIREERRNGAKQVWRLTPIPEYESEELDHITEEGRDYRINTIEEFEKYLLTHISPNSKHNIIGVRDAVEEDVEEWKNNELIPNSDINISTIAGRLQFLKSFYATLNEKDAFAGNPVRGPLDDLRNTYEEELTPPDRPYIPFHRLKTFMNWLKTPFGRAMWLLAFKLGNRRGESVNLDLRCLNIAHPVYDQVVNEHDVYLDPRVRDRPDTILIYSKFNEGSEVPNHKTPGWEGPGEVREAGNKRKQSNGTVLPIDSELKTALIEWLLVRPTTYENTVHPLFALGITNLRRVSKETLQARLWGRDSYSDSIQRFAREQSIDECPTCNSPVTARNLKNGEETGRRYRCRNCMATHWRSIYWDNDLETSQKVVYHQGRHTFSSAHSVKNSDLHEGVISKAVRTEAIRGDSNNQGDTEDKVYIEGQYQNFESDIREAYLNGENGIGIYKFGIYDDPIPAVGEGWDG